MNLRKHGRLTPLRGEEIALPVLAGCLSKIQVARIFVCRGTTIGRICGPVVMPGMTDPAPSRQSSRSGARNLTIPATGGHPFHR